MDRLTTEQRKKNMQAVKSTGSKIEVKLAKALFSKGYRYRKNNKTVFGKPDLTFKKYKIAIFVDSEFWHGKDWNKHKKDHKSNIDFWHQKIEKNIDRDRIVNKELISSGWTVLRFWGKEINKNLDEVISTIEKNIVIKKNGSY
ncbi:very short patch repair endonuclease [Chryseobacterium chendengshani]|uniref:very short patch repair endonuclease n=1 Tax=Chryseobacterium sp. LJ756 TaxID=2864113 RepID=UPI001C64000F|nr:very short patch repair endonuclease [Chryseobacterium sp. LJ756]MBW7674197.1 very short patch repair endonuclease [Chryseobacterium sp. LJ756]